MEEQQQSQQSLSQDNQQNSIISEPRPFEFQPPHDPLTHQQHQQQIQQQEQNLRPPPPPKLPNLPLRRGERVRHPTHQHLIPQQKVEPQPPAPKFKSQLKLKVKQLGEAPTGPSAFLHSYDRELDSEDEDLAIEEQFILRMPENDPDTDRLREMVNKRDVTDDVWFKFKDSRRAAFHIGERLRSAKLVDMPTIIESQKTLDNKQMFKVADISQMLVVGDEIQSENQLIEGKIFNPDDYVWPHGMTPPMRHARKRRFRKRVNRQTIETVEEEVERLLKEDSKAEKSEYELLDNITQDVSDSEVGTPYPDEKDIMATPRLDSELGDEGSMVEPNESVNEGDEGEGEGELDLDLAAEIDKEMEKADENEEGDEEEDEESSSSAPSEEEEEEEVDGETDGVSVELARRAKLLNEEIRDVESALAKKRAETESTANPIIKRRFEDALRKLQADLDSKRGQLDDIMEERRQKADQKKFEEETIDNNDNRNINNGNNNNNNNNNNNYDRNDDQLNEVDDDDVLPTPQTQVQPVYINNESQQSQEPKQQMEVQTPTQMPVHIPVTNDTIPEGMDLDPTLFSTTANEGQNIQEPTIEEEDMGDLFGD